MGTVGTRLTSSFFSEQMGGRYQETEGQCRPVWIEFMCGYMITNSRVQNSWRAVGVFSFFLSSSTTWKFRLFCIFCSTSFRLHLTQCQNACTKITFRVQKWTRDISRACYSCPFLNAVCHFPGPLDAADCLPSSTRIRQLTFPTKDMANILQPER